MATLLLAGIALLSSACASSTVKTVIIPTASPGDIILTLDRPKYTAHQPLGVTITNHSKHTYYAKDGLSACTYLQLEWFDANKNAWVPVDGCTTPNPGQMRQISAGLSLPYTLAPGDSPADANAWVPGVYRVSLSYGAAADGSGTLTPVYSQGFQITSG
jgi:hypothetical protein